MPSTVVVREAGESTAERGMSLKGISDRYDQAKGGVV